MRSDHNNKIINENLGEKCGIFGVFGKGMEAARLTYAGLWALQHRGQESSGISASNGKFIRTHKGQGLVSRVYDESSLRSLQGHIAIGQNRYSTSGGSDARHNQPVFREGGLLALGHNGNLPTVSKLKQYLKGKHVDVARMNDSELMYTALSVCLLKGQTIEEAMKECFPLFTGVFSLLVMTNDKMIAMRDTCGIRPLSIGKLNGGYVVSSETCALDIVNANYLRDVLPGEMVVIDKKGLHSYQIAKGNLKLDIFEFVYFARPDSVLLGKSVYEVRRNFGKLLALENKIQADVVIPVPDSAVPAAIGFAEVSRIPFDNGFIKNRYIHRTFIRPAQRLRERDIDIKLNVLPSVLKGKRVIIVDDSIVRGTTAKKIIAKVRRAGAKKVYLLVSSPPVMYPDFYGINTPDQSELIATRMKIRDIAKHIGADSVKYLSYRGLIQATGLSEELFNTSCFTGQYPVDIGYHKKKIISSK